MPREGTETALLYNSQNLLCVNLEIRCPERGRKQYTLKSLCSPFTSFGNKMPREGTETEVWDSVPDNTNVFGNKMPREGTET